jgi:hypothetical protein
LNCSLIVAKPPSPFGGWRSCWHISVPVEFGQPHPFYNTGDILVIQPIVRYMILCEDYEIGSADPLRINVLGLLTRLAADGPPPFLLDELCCVLVLTEGRGSAWLEICCVFEETQQLVFSTPPRIITFGDDPLEMTLLPYRILECKFPWSGVYSVQVRYNGSVLVECPLRVG